MLESGWGQAKNILQGGTNSDTATAVLKCENKGGRKCRAVGVYLDTTVVYTVWEDFRILKRGKSTVFAIQQMEAALQAYRMPFKDVDGSLFKPGPSLGVIWRCNKK